MFEGLDGQKYVHTRTYSTRGAKNEIVPHMIVFLFSRTINNHNQLVSHSFFLSLCTLNEKTCFKQVVHYTDIKNLQDLFEKFILSNVKVL